MSWLGAVVGLWLGSAALGSSASASRWASVVRLPDGVSLGSASSPLSPEDLVQLNLNLLGLSAAKPKGLPGLVGGDALRRAEAVAVLLPTESWPAAAEERLALSGGSLPAFLRSAEDAMPAANSLNIDQGHLPAKDGVPDFIQATVKSQAQMEDVLSRLEAEYGKEGFAALLVSLPARQKRETQQLAASPPPAATGNPQQIYLFSSSNYSAAFHIILFASLAIGLSVLFIGCGMWEMDPGKDSIIYRMTMSRAKKD